MISGIVRTALTGLVGGRCWPNEFEQPDRGPPTWPAIRYTLVSSDPTPDICGTETVLLDDVRVQIDVVAKTYGAAVVLRDQVIAAMMNVTPPATRQTMFELKDAETKTHRVIIDYVFYQSSSLTGSPT